MPETEHGETVSDVANVIDVEATPVFLDSLDSMEGIIEPEIAPDGITGLLPGDPDLGEPFGSQKRTKAQREEDLALTAKMVIKKISHADIARHIGSIRPYTLSRKQISYDVLELNRRWKRRFLLPLPTLKSKELAAIDAQEREAWDAWERSKEDGLKAMRITEDAPSQGQARGRGGKTVNHKEKRDGDPRFLDILIKLGKRRAEILGLDAPVKIDGDMQHTHNIDVPRLRKAYEDRVRERIESGKVLSLPGAATG